jgi:hypothetical protein
MSEEKFDDGVRQIYQAIELCLTNNLALPAMQLLYAAMDIMGSLNGPPDPPKPPPKSKTPKQGSRFRFQRWVRRYMLRNAGAPYRAVDLYAARCGVLHEFTPNSDLVRWGRAKKLLYSWGKGEIGLLEEVLKRSRSKTKAAAIDLDYLYADFKKAVEMFKEDLKKNPKRHREVYDRATEFFSTFSFDREGKLVAQAGSHKEAGDH